jgi:hypothetical protein
MMLVFLRIPRRQVLRNVGLNLCAPLIFGQPETVTKDLAGKKTAAVVLLKVFLCVNSSLHLTTYNINVVSNKGLEVEKQGPNYFGSKQPLT